MHVISMFVPCWLFVFDGRPGDETAHEGKEDRGYPPRISAQLRFHGSLVGLSPEAVLPFVEPPKKGGDVGALVLSPAGEVEFGYLETAKNVFVGLNPASLGGVFDGKVDTNYRSSQSGRCSKASRTSARSSSPG